MPKLLYIEASPRKERSASIAVAQAYLAALRINTPELSIDRLDLWAEALPRFDGATIDAKYAILNKQAHSAEQAAAWRAVEQVIARFKAADRLLFSVPMWNFNVPYVLKHYIDIVTQPTLTFSFSPDAGYRGLVRGKQAMVIYASSGDYAPGSGNPRPDFQKPFLEAWLRFIGIEDIRTVTVAPTIADPARVERAHSEAINRAVLLSH